jgi:hypothetical protein
MAAIPSLRSSPYRICKTSLLSTSRAPNRLLLHHNYIFLQLSTKEYDFSDASNDKLKTKAVKMVECNNGTYFTTKARNGHPTYDSFSLEELAKIDKGGVNDCDCEVCVA